jgi:Mg2+ and Co2+ transporter CorA
MLNNFEVGSERIVYQSSETQAYGQQYKQIIQQLNVGVTEIIQREKYLNFLHSTILALLNENM